MNSILRKYLFLAFALVALMAILSFTSGNADAKTCYSHTSGNADVAATWINGVPAAGDNLVFQGAYNVALNQAITYGSITFLANYSGTTTQGAVSFGCTVFDDSAMSGTFTAAGGSTYFVTASGSVNVNGGTLTSAKLRLIMTGAGVTLTNGNTMLYLRISGSVTSDASGTLAASSTGGGLVVDAGANLILTNTMKVRYYSGGAASFIDNSGTISGSGTLTIYLYDADQTLTANLGTITAPFKIDLSSGAAASHTLSLGKSYSLTAPITVISEDATNAMTLDLASYSLTTTSITASTRGIISSSVAGAKLMTTGAITVSANGQLVATNIAWISCGGNFDPSAGTWTPSTHQVNITSSYKAVKLGAGQTFYNLQLVNNTNVTGQASMTHLIKYSGMGANLLYHWKNATTIGNYQANASGLIDIPGRILYVANLYRMEKYMVWGPTFSAPTTTGRETVAYSYSLTINETGTVTAINIPAWLTLSHNGTTSTPWVLSGTPSTSQSGSYSVKIKGLSSAGTLYSYQNFTLIISDTWGPTFSAPTTTGQKTVAYSCSFTLNETGTVTAINIPAWLTLSHNGTSTTPWVLSGTPSSSGSFSINIKGLSSAGLLYGYQNFSIMVKTTWAPTFSTPTLYGLTGILYSYSFTLNETGTVTAINIPAWLTLSHNGTSTTPWVLSGLSNLSGPFSIKIKGLSTPGLLYGYENFTLTINNSVIAPVAAFSASVTNGTITLSVTFSDSSTNTPTNWTWIFGDGGTSYVQNPTHAYSVAGNYTVSLKAKNSAGSDYENKTSYIHAQVLPPIPSIPTTLSASVLLSLGLLAIITLLAIYVRDIRPFAGIAWVVLPLTTMLSYGIPVILITVIIGIVLIYLWAVE